MGRGIEKGQNLIKDDPYKNIPHDQKDKKVIDDFVRWARGLQVDAGNSNATVGEILTKQSQAKETAQLLRLKDATRQSNTDVSKLNLTNEQERWRNNPEEFPDKPFTVNMIQETINQTTGPTDQQIRQKLEDWQHKSPDDNKTYIYKALESLIEINAKWASKRFESTDTVENLEASFITGPTDALLEKLNETDMNLTANKMTKAIENYRQLENLADNPLIEDTIHDWKKKYLTIPEEVSRQQDTGATGSSSSNSTEDISHSIQQATGDTGSSSSDPIKDKPNLDMVKDILRRLSIQSLSNGKQVLSSALNVAHRTYEFNQDTASKDLYKSIVTLKEFLYEEKPYTEQQIQKAMVKVIQNKNLTQSGSIQVIVTAIETDPLQKFLESV